MSLTPPPLPPDSQHAKRKSGRSGGSGLFPAIKTALVGVCHRKKVRGVTTVKGYGELDLGLPQGRPHKPACLVRIRTPQNTAFFHRTTHLQPAAPAGQSSSSEICSKLLSATQTRFMTVCNMSGTSSGNYHEPDCLLVVECKSMPLIIWTSNVFSR